MTLRTIAKRSATVCVLALLTIGVRPNLQAQHDSRGITFPDVPGYLTLKADLHLHTVFSDGKVWPDIRVREAIRDGLDAIAVTDHIEYLPHKEDIPFPDRNRSYDIAVDVAARLDSNLIVVLGSEITRSMPPGHANAVFLEDVNPMIKDDPIDVYREASRQGAFTFWNHPAWVGQEKDAIAKLTDLHRMLIDEELLHGIEVVNMHDYSQEALRIALENDLTILGTSDIHGLVDWEFEHNHFGHRPITLVYATDRTRSALREALFAGRTTVWFRNMLIGREEYVLPLIGSSLQVSSATYDRDRAVLAVELANGSDVRYILQNESDYTFQHGAELVEIAANATTTLNVKTIEQIERVSLRFEVLNAVTAPEEHPHFQLDVSVD